MLGFQKCLFEYLKSMLYVAFTIYTFTKKNSYMKQYYLSPTAYGKCLKIENFQT